MSSLTCLDSSCRVLRILLKLWVDARFYVRRDIVSPCEGEVAVCVALIFVKCFVDKHFSDRTDCRKSVSLPLGNLHAFKISAVPFYCISHA